MELWLVACQQMLFLFVLARVAVGAPSNEITGSATHVVSSEPGLKSVSAL